MQVAREHGMYIPTLCDHPHLAPLGSCRLCMVEVEGWRVPVASCTHIVSNGMVVSTDTPKLRAIRKSVLTLLFGERNHFCPFCQLSGGDCELQNAAYHEDMTHWPLMPGWKSFPLDTSHPFMAIDHNRCILCRRCVRACSDLVGNFTLGIIERGANSMLAADANTDWGRSSCAACGTCLQVCPTGALIDRQSAYHGHEKDLIRTRTVCVGCSVGCGIDVLTMDNNLIRIEGDWSAPVNGGVLCKEGRFIPLADNRMRIAAPLIRKNGALKPATWDEALQTVTARVKKDGDVAAVISTRQPAETLSLFKQLFVDQLNSTMVTSLEEGKSSALPAVLADGLGHSFEGRLDVLSSADCVLAIGVDLVASHEIAGFFVKRSLPKGIRLVVVDPHENGLDGLAHYTLKASRGADLDVIEALKAALNRGDLRTPAAKTGLAIEAITVVADLLASATNPVIIYGKGITANTDLATMQALLDLARLVGAVDDAHSALISVKGKANSLVAAQYRLDKPFELNGHQMAYALLGDDTPNERLLQCLEKVPFLVVQATYTSPLSERADVVLPVASWAEQGGHFLNLEGRLQEAFKAVQAPDGVWESGAVLAALAASLNLPVNGNWKEALLERVPPVAISE